jgi:hypothetical protein
MQAVRQQKFPVERAVLWLRPELPDLVHSTHRHESALSRGDVMHLARADAHKAAYPPLMRFATFRPDARESAATNSGFIAAQVERVLVLQVRTRATEEKS